MGRTYLFYGAGGLWGTHQLTEAAATFTGTTEGDDLAGLTPGDFNGDGWIDLVFGAPGYDNDRGAVWVVFGPGT